MIKFPKEVLEETKKHLEKELSGVEEQIKELKTQDPFADVSRLNDNAASDAEAAEEVDHERLQALINELNAKKAALMAALTRIAAGTYGICASCGQLIDTDRLAAMPTATLCMACSALKKGT
jgi:RNA polymerase-binding transcription factor DksA